MTSDDFRRIALGLQGTVESSHMGHPDFRAHGRIFATLHTDSRWGMVKLAPRDQSRVIDENPGTFAPESGAWGREGCTRVRLASVDDEVLGEAMTLAWRHAADRSTSGRVRVRRSPARLKSVRRR